eukprot:215045_1
MLRDLSPVLQYVLPRLCEAGRRMSASNWHLRAHVPHALYLEVAEGAIQQGKVPHVPAGVAFQGRRSRWAGGRERLAGGTDEYIRAVNVRINRVPRFEINYNIKC